MTRKKDRRRSPAGRKLCALAGTLAVLGWGGSSLAAPSDLKDGDCLWCHGKPSIAETPPEELLAMVRVPDGAEPILRRPEEIARLFTAPDLKSPPHVTVQCVDCHGSVKRLPHDQRLPAVDCGRCHDGVRDAVARGSHAPSGAAPARRRPACTDCHGPAHEIQWQVRSRTFASAVHSVYTCVTCHDNGESASVRAVKSYRENVHGHALFEMGLPMAAVCVDCHGSHAMLPPSNPESPLHALKVPDTCGKCHQGVEEVFLASIHGRELASGNAEGATCTSCHSDHGIHESGEAFLAAVVSECSHCHIELGRTYLTSYHGKATTLGDRSVAVCSSCHGSHDILPNSDPRSRVAPANLKATCGKCHEDANDNFVSFLTHVDHRDRARFPAVYYTWLAMTTLLLGVLAFFVPHSVIWTIRETVERVRHGFFRKRGANASERYIERFRPVHRWTHLLIIVSFMGLVATGFPLKYSYTDWAKNISAALGGAHVMGLLHRFFAILTLVYVLVHVGYLVYFFIWKCPRPRYRYLLGPNSMFFSVRDLKHFWEMLRWFFFLGPRPRFDRWNYLEKFDYWGEIWGVIVIGGSGLMLWFPTFFTRWLPGWVLNCALVVHSIEALLAASVIFLVHFLNTHLRPDKFPVDMVMLTGHMSESEMKEERPAEYERLVESGEIEERLVTPAGIRFRVAGRIAGLLALFCGVTLIVLAIVSEFEHLF